MRDIWFCNCCKRQTELEHDGTHGYCVGCQTQVVNRGDIFHAAWFPFVQLGVSAISRPAGVVLSTLKAADESAPPNLQPLLELAALVMVGVIGGLVLQEALRSR